MRYRVVPFLVRLDAMIFSTLKWVMLSASSSSEDDLSGRFLAERFLVAAFRLLFFDLPIVNRLACHHGNIGNGETC